MPVSSPALVTVMMTTVMVMVMVLHAAPHIVPPHLLVTLTLPHHAITDACQCRMPRFPLQQQQQQQHR